MKPKECCHTDCKNIMYVEDYELCLPLQCEKCQEEKEEIQVGKKYTLRNGLITEEIKISEDGTGYVFEAKVKEPQHKDFSVFCWKRNGRYLTNFTDHKFDIILKGW